MGASKGSASALATIRLTRRTLLGLSALAGGSALTVGLAPRRGSSAPRVLPSDGCSASSALPSAITAVMQKPRYARSTWSLLVTDLATGENLYELQPDQMALTGSVRKLFSVGLALKQLGADHRFTTPVYRRGAVDAQGVLSGDLVLVAAGDLTLGGRLQADGRTSTTTMRITWAPRS